MTFLEAQVVCQGESAELASLSDHYQEAFVKTVLYNNGFDSMWLGMMDDQVRIYSSSQNAVCALQITCKLHSFTLEDS